jgi:outer membrane lipoprotein-sorting protein
MKKRHLFGALGIWILMGAVALGQTADEIVKKYVDAIGGYETIKKIQTLKATGKVIMQQGTMEMPLVYYAKRPNKLRYETKLQGQTMIQAYDGKTAWWIFPYAGNPEPQIMPEEQAKEFLLNADFDGQLIDYKEKGHKVEYVGKEDVEGTETHKLKVTLKSGDVLYYYLDGEYYIPIKMSMKRTRKGVELEAETYFGDYKEVAGMLVAHSIETRVGGKPSVQVVLDSIRVNVDLPDSLFVMPAREEEKKPQK